MQLQVASSEYHPSGQEFLLQENLINTYLGFERLSFLVSVEMVRSLEET